MIDPFMLQASNHPHEELMENGELFSNQRLETLLPAKFKPVVRSDHQIEPELSTCLDFYGKC